MQGDRVASRVSGAVEAALLTLYLTRLDPQPSRGAQGESSEDLHRCSGNMPDLQTCQCLRQCFLTAEAIAQNI